MNLQNNVLCECKFLCQHKSILYPTRKKGSIPYPVLILGIIEHPASFLHPVSVRFFQRIPYPVAQKILFPYPVKPYRGPPSVHIVFLRFMIPVGYLQLLILVAVDFSRMAPYTALIRGNFQVSGFVHMQDFKWRFDWELTVVSVDCFESSRYCIGMGVHLRYFVGEGSLKG